MKSSEKGSAIKIILLIIIVIAVAIAGFLGYTRIKGKIADEKNQKREMTIGVINYEDLVTIHPDFKELERLEQEINQIQTPSVDENKVKNLSSSLSKKMIGYQKQMEAALEMEKNRIQADNAAKVRALELEIKSAYAKKQAELLKYQKQLESEYKVKQNEKRPPSAWEKEFKTRVQSQSKDLIMLEERQIAAKRLEAEKKTQERLLAHKQRMDGILRSYEEEIHAKNQNAKLDLQLKVQVAKDDEERNKIQEQLEEIRKGEQTSIDEKRKQLADEFKQYENDEDSKNKVQLTRYRAKLDVDVSRQLETIKRQVGNKMYSQGIARNEQETSSNPEELKHKMAVKQKQIEQELNSLTSGAKMQIAAIESQAKANFETRRDELFGKLGKYQKELEGEYQRKQKEMRVELESANSEQQKERKKLINQRRNLYDRIINDINKVVSDIAKQQGIDLVAGEYETNVDAKDLNDLAREAVKALKKSKPESSPAK